MRGKNFSWGRLASCAILLLAARTSTAGSPDLNDDGFVDITDYSIFRGCMSGPGVEVSGVLCDSAHFDADPDVDLADYARLARQSHPGFLANFCDSPIDAFNGTVPFTTDGATTDGAPDPLCSFFNFSQVSNDIWYCYEAPCTGPAAFGLCGSSYDTKLAVYEGCNCPTSSPLVCNDDGCGSDFSLVQSRVTVNVVAGHQYMVRIGGYVGAGSPGFGAGVLTIRCGDADTCTPNAGDCFTGHEGTLPGCANSNCCHSTCSLDRFCCDITWDDYCAGEAVGVCTGNFASCTPNAGACNSAHPLNSSGCDNNACCNLVCGSDTFCCLVQWDSDCADEANVNCLLACSPSAGDCFSSHNGVGCNEAPCCQSVCASDPFCCDTQWDQNCAVEAFDLCPF